MSNHAGALPAQPVTRRVAWAHLASILLPWRGTLVHLYSFSKVFALTGYRVGGITAGTSLMAEIEKAVLRAIGVPVA